MPGVEYHFRPREKWIGMQAAYTEPECNETSLNYSGRYD
jgi:hypothetical protein